MFRAATVAARQVVSRTAARGGRKLPPAFAQRLEFHVTSKRQEEAAVIEKKETAAPATPPAESSGGMWDPMYAIPLGIAFAVPAINYEWYLVNEETQLAACMIMFTALVYKNFGGTIHEMMEEDGKAILAEHNKTEDEIITALQAKRKDVVLQEHVVQDAQDVYDLKVETYEKLNAAGKIKPLHDFKSQMERMLSLMQHEEEAMKERSKIALMVEATAAVTTELTTNKTLQQASLNNAISILKTGKSAGADPVKDAYMQFFKWKADQAKKVDEKQELAGLRSEMLTKLNAVAANEGFYFKFGESGKPVMTV